MKHMKRKRKDLISFGRNVWVSHVMQMQMGLRYKHECVWTQAALGPLL